MCDSLLGIWYRTPLSTSEPEFTETKYPMSNFPSIVPVTKEPGCNLGFTVYNRDKKNPYCSWNAKATFNNTKRDTKCRNKKAGTSDSVLKNIVNIQMQIFLKQVDWFHKQPSLF